MGPVARPGAAARAIYFARGRRDTGGMKRYVTLLLRGLALFGACVWALGAPGLAQTAALDGGLSALARLDARQSAIGDVGWDGLQVSLALSQAVPWRVRVLDGPPRLLLDFREVDFSDLANMPVESDLVLGLRAGVFRPTWSRLVVQLAQPMVVARAQMETGERDQGAQVTITLTPASAEAFAAAVAQPEPPEWQLPKPADLPPPRLPLSAKTGPLVVVLDPGHGGIDPGAQQGGVNEADLMLIYARAVKEALLRSGEAQVILTRDADVFVPLEARISIARAAAADVFVSLHADALAEGDAKGATIYTLSAEATDKAAQTLAERHDRDDLLAGVDLTAQDDLIAHVLMDMARLETQPRIDRLALALEAAIKDRGIKMHRRARQTAGFSVLKSPDIPSVLIELGFMSAPQDLANLQDPDWRARMSDAIARAILTWAAGERAGPAAP
jgi:N-acetylmuramoyl-L-alanine amidase